MVLYARNNGLKAVLSITIPPFSGYAVSVAICFGIDGDVNVTKSLDRSKLLRRRICHGACVLYDVFSSLPLRKGRMKYLNLELSLFKLTISIFFLK